MTCVLTTLSVTVSRSSAPIVTQKSLRKEVAYLLLTCACIVELCHLELPPGEKLRVVRENEWFELTEVRV